LFGRGLRLYSLGDEWYGGSNVTIEIIQRILKEVELVEGALPLKLLLQLDGSGKENKNQYNCNY
jgi:hypothetical protein